MVADLVFIREKVHEHMCALVSVYNLGVLLGLVLLILFYLQIQLELMISITLSFTSIFQLGQYLHMNYSLSKSRINVQSKFKYSFLKMILLSSMLPIIYILID